MSSIVYQESAKYNGLKGTLILNKENIRFVNITHVGEHKVLFSLQLNEFSAQSSLIGKKLKISLKNKDENLSIEVNNPKIWVKKISSLI